MITYNNIVQRFKEFADNHFFIQTFTHGSPEDVDLTKYTEFPLLHLVYTGATYDDGSKTYNLEVYILDLPNDKEGKVEPQREAVSDAEQCAEDIIADVKNGGNIFLFAEDYEVVNATTSPLEEANSNVLSGVLLDLSVQIPYQWDSCNAPIDGVTAGGSEIQYARRGVLRVKTQNGTVDVLSVQTIQVSNGTLTDDGQGTISLDTAGAENLDELTDVSISSVVNGQVLRYSGIAPTGWYNYTLELGDLNDTKGTPSEGQYLRYTGGFWQPSGIVMSLNDLSDVNTTGAQSGDVLLRTASGYVVDTVPALSGTNITRTLVSNVNQFNLNDSISLSTVTADTLQSTGNMVLKIDSDNNQSGRTLTVTDGAGNVRFKVDESGNVQINEAYTLPSSDGAANAIMKTDGSGAVSFGANLSDLSDVAPLTPTSGYVLTWSGSEWQPAASASPPPAPVDSVNGQTGTVVLDADDIDDSTTTNKYTTAADISKLAGIAAGAEVNVNADWNAGSGDAQILNKPTLATVATSGSYADLSNTPSIPSAIGDLSDVPASLGTAGQVLAVNSGGTALEYVAQSGGGGSTVSLKGKFVIWAEESATLSASTNGGYQWSYGNGDTATVGLALPFDCTAVQMLFNCDSAGTSGAVELRKGTSATSTSSAVVGSISFGSVISDTVTFATPQSFSAGDWMTFRTSAASGTYDDPRVGVVFEYDIADLTAYQGSQGPSGTSYDVTTITTSTTLSSSHTTKYLVCNSASAMNLTVPASAAYDTYAEFVIEQRGAGQVTVVADTGVTIHSTETLKSGAQYAVMGLKRTDTNTYVLTGEREAAP